MQIVQTSLTPGGPGGLTATTKHCHIGEEKLFEQGSVQLLIYSTFSKQREKGLNIST